MVIAPRLRSLINGLFPQRCIICLRTSDNARAICSNCQSHLPEIKASCARCALPLALEPKVSTVCGRCIKSQPSFDYISCGFRYEDAVIALVHQLKFNDKLSYASVLGKLMLQHYLANTLPDRGKPDLILPVPLHPSRLRHRGFNQSLELSRALLEQMELPLSLKDVTRNRRTPPQAGLNADLRKKNIKGAFQVRRSIKARHILIVDDVVTTGSTVDELAGLLKEQGVESVGVLCFARAPLKN